MDIPQIAILVADSQHLFAESLGSALAGYDDLDVCQEFPDHGLETAQAVQRLQPRVVVLDHWLREMDGPTTTRLIKQWSPTTRVVLVESFYSRRHVDEAIRSGADAIVAKDLTLAHVAGAVRRVAQVSAGASPRPGLPTEADRAPRLPTPPERSPGQEATLRRLLSLTPREVEVLQLLADGVNVTQAARRLGITVGTMRNHVRHVFAKTGAASQIQVVNMARLARLVGSPRTAPAIPSPNTAVELPKRLAAPIPAGPPTVVMVADAQPLFAETLADALGRRPGLEVLGVRPGTGLSVVQEAVNYRPDVLVVDCWMPELSGPDITRLVHRWAPTTKLLLTSGIHGPDQVREALRAGATGYLPKGLTVDDVVEAIRRAHAGEPLVFANELARLLDDVSAKAVASEEASRRVKTLTPRETEVLRLLASGSSTKQVALDLGLSATTVKSHVRSILSKTGTESQLQAVNMAWRRLGLDPPLGRSTEPGEVGGSFDAW